MTIFNLGNPAFVYNNIKILAKSQTRTTFILFRQVLKKIMKMLCLSISL